MNLAPGDRLFVRHIGGRIASGTVSTSHTHAAGILLLYLDREEEGCIYTNGKPSLLVAPNEIIGPAPDLSTRVGAEEWLAT